MTTLKTIMSSKLKGPFSSTFSCELEPGDTLFLAEIIRLPLINPRVELGTVRLKGLEIIGLAVIPRTGQDKPKELLTPLVSF